MNFAHPFEEFVAEGSIFLTILAQHRPVKKITGVVSVARALERAAEPAPVANAKQFTAQNQDNATLSRHRRERGEYEHILLLQTLQAHDRTHLHRLSRTSANRESQDTPARPKPAGE